jgi:hypothetical protein
MCPKFTNPINNINMDKIKYVFYVLSVLLVWAVIFYFGGMVVWKSDCIQKKINHNKYWTERVTELNEQIERLEYSIKLAIGEIRIQDEMEKLMPSKEERNKIANLLKEHDMSMPKEIKDSVYDQYKRPGFTLESYENLFMFMDQRGRYPTKSELDELWPDNMYGYFDPWVTEVIVKTFTEIQLRNLENHRKWLKEAKKNLAAAKTELQKNR